MICGKGVEFAAVELFYRDHRVVGLKGVAYFLW